jgi:hypothetical protein
MIIQTTVKFRIIHRTMGWLWIVDHGVIASTESRMYGREQSARDSLERFAKKMNWRLREKDYI